MKNIEAEFTYKQLKEMRDKPIKQLARKKVSGRMVKATARPSERATETSGGDGLGLARFGDGENHR